jgi:dolichol kinase
VSREGARKALHLATSAVPLAYAAGVSRTLLLWFLGAALAVALLVELARRQSPAVAQRFVRWTAGMLRAEESSGALTGATWMALGYVATLVIAPRDAAIAAMWAVAAGDGVATLVGRRFGTPGTKSVAGSVAMLLVTVLGGWWVAELALGWAVAAALAATVAERWPAVGNDNVRIPTAVFVVLSIR